MEDHDVLQNSKKLSRRGFLQAAAALGAGVAVLGTGAGITAQRAQAQSAPAKKTLRQWAMVIDLRRCDGCVTANEAPQCTEACNREHFVPPGQQWIRVFKIDDLGGSHFLPRPCMQCENAPCLNVCPVGATYRNSEGVVLIDHRKCIGCRLCMSACPYNARSFNWGDPPNPPGATFAQYSPEFPVPHRRGTAEKCMLCAHHLADGHLPACAAACPMQAIYLGDLTEDVATNAKDVVKLSRFLSENSAFRLKEELGTRPRVWYIGGHGEEFGRAIDDQRNLKDPAPWTEQRATKKEA